MKETKVMKNTDTPAPIKESEVELTLKSVNEVVGATAINRNAARRHRGKPVQLDMAVRLVPDLTHSALSLVVSCSYIYVGQILRERLLTCSVICNFEVKDLSSHVERKGEDVIVSSQLMRLMLSIAVGALRGVVAVRTEGTALESRPLPIVDLTALMYRLHYGSSPSIIFR